MDGLSLVASLVSVIQVTASCLRLTRKWIGSSDFSSADLVDVSNTLYEFNGSLKNFETHVGILEDDQSRLHSLEHLKLVLERCKDALGIVKDCMEKRGFVDKYLLGPKVDHRLKRSLKTLDEAKEIFILALHSDQQAILLRVERYMHNINENLREHNERINTAMKELHQDEEKTYQQVKLAGQEQREWAQSLNTTTRDIKATVDSQERERILDWLTPNNYTSQQNDFIARRQVDTGQWLLESPEYLSWSTTKGSTLFCQGDPGAGKTILASIVVDSLISTLNGTTSGIAYIYCNFRRQDEQRPEDLMASLLRQLAESQPFIPKCVKDLFGHHNTRRAHLRIKEIMNAIVTIAAGLPKVFLIIDALDECQALDRRRGRFIAKLCKLQKRTHANLFITSRFVPNIKYWFTDSVMLEIRATDDDLRRYLNGQMYRMPKFITRNSKLQEDIKSRIITVVGGMYEMISLGDELALISPRFLLAQLHVDSLRGKMSTKAVYTTLANLATGSNAYDETYAEAMARIESQLPDETRLAKECLLWTTCAKRELTTTELQHALGVETGEPNLDPENLPDIEDVLSVCAGLVTLDEETNIVRLVHYTAQEYFKRTQDTWFPNAAQHIAQVCLTYISFDSFYSGPCDMSGYKHRLESYPFYEYAARHWGDHIRRDQGLISETMSFLENQSLLQASSQALNITKREISSHHLPDQNIPTPAKLPQITGLHIAAHFGLSEASMSLLAQGHQPNPEGFYRQTPLLIAAENGHDRVVSALLTSNDTNVNHRDMLGQSALSLAASKGHKVTVKELLSHHALDLSTKLHLWQAPLPCAILNGHEDIVRLLCDHGAEINTKYDDGTTPLLLSIKEGHDNIATLLLGKDADCNLVDDAGDSPLSCAVLDQRFDLVKLLLEKGSTPDIKDYYGQTPLMRAIELGNESLSMLLIDQGANPNITDDCYRSHLIYAVKHRLSTIVCLLLKHAANINLEDDRGWTALTWAAESGFPIAIRMLLEQNATIDLRDAVGRTPLSYAAERGHVEVVAALLEEGADVGIEDHQGHTPLSYAVDHGWQDVIKLLLNRNET